MSGEQWLDKHSGRTHACTHTGDGSMHVGKFRHGSLVTCKQLLHGGGLAV